MLDNLLLDYVWRDLHCDISPRHDSSWGNRAPPSGCPGLLAEWRWSDRGQTLLASKPGSLSLLTGTKWPLPPICRKNRGLLSISHTFMWNTFISKSWLTGVCWHSASQLPAKQRESAHADYCLLIKFFEFNLFCIAPNHNRSMQTHAGFCTCPYYLYLKSLSIKSSPTHQATEHTINTLWKTPAGCILIPTLFL